MIPFLLIKYLFIWGKFWKYELMLIYNFLKQQIHVQELPNCNRQKFICLCNFDWNLRVTINKFILAYFLSFNHQSILNYIYCFMKLMQLWFDGGSRIVKSYQNNPKLKSKFTQIISAGKLILVHYNLKIDVYSSQA